MLNYKNETVLIKLVTLLKINGPNLELLLNNVGRSKTEGPRSHGAHEKSLVCKGAMVSSFQSWFFSMGRGEKKVQRFKKKKKNLLINKIFQIK